jgi:hypothetical protein
MAAMTSSPELSSAHSREAEPPAPTIDEAMIREAIRACRRAVHDARKSAAIMGGEHEFAYAIVPASERGRPSLAIVTGAGEACLLTKGIIDGMMADYLETMAWYGTLAVILSIDSRTDVDVSGCLASINVCALPVSACGDRRHMVKLRGVHRAADGKLLVLTRRSPWACLPNARTVTEPGSPASGLEELP